MNAIRSILGRDLTGSLHATLRSEGGREAESRDELEAATASADEAKHLGIRAGSPLILVEG